ncbi:MAG TPA: LysM peptidoglycan-binding domain-containing protein [Actinomycetes bacterium]|nr:LysM peptidoglycan-binding domain-containing protein [Actinomycetes bacterium]
MIEHTFPATARTAGTGHRAGGPARRRGREGAGPLRLGAVAILLLAAFLLLVAPALVRARDLGRAESRVAYQRPVSYTVRPGDTLWSIALRIAPGRDPRPLVDRLIAYNHLQGDLQVGQAIYLPAPVR